MVLGECISSLGVLGIEIADCVVDICKAQGGEERNIREKGIEEEGGGGQVVENLVCP